MKNYFIPFSCLILLALFFKQQPVLAYIPQDTLNQEGIKGDSLQYELLIFDAEFQSWYNQVQQPPSFYSQQYLENWNEQLVSQWNTQIPNSLRAACLQDSYIQYDANTDYGLELNHRLFYYFRYIHQRCNIFFNVPGRW